MRSHSRATRGAMLAVLLLPAVLSGGRPIYDCLRTGTRHFQSCCCQGSEKPAEPARPACCSKHAQPGNPATPAAPEPCGCCKVTIVVFNAPAAKDATPGHDTRAGIDPWMQDPQRLRMLTHEDGISMSESLAKVYRNQEEHDPSNLNRAREIASIENDIPVGILYRNEEVPCYEDLRTPNKIRTPEYVRAGLESEFDKFTI